MNVTVVGAGKMGLPVACQFAALGARVTACDSDAAVVEAINRGMSRVEEPGLADLLTEVTADGRLCAATDTASAVSESDVVVVLVPALLTPERDADLSILLAASRDIARGLRRGTMVSYETTVPIGSTRQRLGPTLAEGGLQPGRDFDLVFSPERVKSRSVLRNLTVNPKVVGGGTVEAAERGALFYEEFLAAPVINVGSLEAAELVKLAGMVYRDINIGVANELAAYSEAVGVDLTALLPAINSDGEAALLAPGIGVGGHCTPVYPHFYLRDAERRGVEATLASAARATNDGQARRSIERIESRWQSLRGQTVLLLGLGFRPEVKEDACSTTYILCDELRKRGATALVHDSVFTAAEIEHRAVEPASLDADVLPPVVVLVTAHDEYLRLSFEDLAKRGVKVIVDGRNVWSDAEAASAGLVYIGMGRPDRARPEFVRLGSTLSEVVGRPSGSYGQAD